MDIWVWTVIAVLLTALPHESGAENIAERSFITSNAQDGNLYSVRYDLIDEYGSSSLNKLTETSPFHEVYSIKGKGGEIQRIHYATDNKGLRANFHSTSENVPSSFVPAFQQSPFMWPSVANPDQNTFVNPEDPMSFPTLGFLSNNPPQPQVGDKFQIPSGLSNSEGIYVNNADKLTESLKSIQFDGESLMTPVSQAPDLQDNFRVYPVLQTEPAMSGNKKDSDDVFSHVDVEIPYQAEIYQSPSGFKQVDYAPEGLYGNIVRDLLRMPKPTHFSSGKTEKENSSPESTIKIREKSFSVTNPQVPTLSPTLSDVPSTLKQPAKLPPMKQSGIDAKKYSQTFPSKEMKSSSSSSKSKLLSLNEKNQRKMTKVESNKQKTQKVMKKLKPTLDLEKKDLSILSSPVSTVFDISTDNGRYYHYVLNMAKPEMKNSLMLKSKYFSTGNALLKLLNETGVSYKIEDFALSNGQTQKFQPSLDIVYSENRDIPVNVPGPQNEVISTDKVSDIKPIEVSQSSSNKTHILEKVEENLQTTLAKEETTTEHSTYIPFSTTTEISTSNDLEVTTLSQISDFGENNESETTTIAVNPTKIPVMENLTEEVEAGSLYITVPKLLAPLNWLFNTSSKDNKSEIETISSSSPNENTTTVFKELAESTTVGLDQQSGNVITEVSDNNTVITTTLVPTTKPYTTTLVDTTTKSEKIIIPANITSVTPVETTTSNIADALDIISTVATELPNNETKYFVTENPNNASEMENNTEVSSMTTIAASVSNNGISSEAANPMVTIQVNDFNELMSRLHKLSVELATSATKNRSAVVTDKPKKIKDKKEHRDKTGNVNLSLADNSPEIKTSPILSDLNLFSLMESEESFSKQLPKIKTSDHQVEKVESPFVKYSLIHPSLLRNGAISLLRFDPYIPQNTNTYSSTSSPGLTDFILRNSNFNSNQNRQSPGIPIQSPSKVNSLGNINENIYQLVSDSNNEQKLIPEDKSSVVNEVWKNLSQNNLQNIEMVQPSLFPITGGNSFIVDYSSELPVANQEGRNPEISQAVEDVVIHGNNFGQNNNNLDLTYGNAYIDILRLNGSEADDSQVAELEVLEYVPVEGLADNFDANSVIAGTGGLYLQDPVLIFEDYREESNQRLQIPDNNAMVDGTFSSYNNGELPLLIIDDSSAVFGDRLQVPQNSVNTPNSQTNNQLLTF